VTTPLLPHHNLSEEETRRAYRRGKIVGVFLALGFLIALALFLVSIDVWVLGIGKRGLGGEGGGDGNGGGEGSVTGMKVGIGMFKSRIDRDIDRSIER